VFSRLRALELFIGEDTEQMYYKHQDVYFF